MCGQQKGQNRAKSNVLLIFLKKIGFFGSKGIGNGGSGAVLFWW